MEIRLTFRSEIYISGETVADVKRIWDELPLFTADALDYGALPVELVTVDDAESGADLMGEWNAASYSDASCAPDCDLPFGGGDFNEPVAPFNDWADREAWNNTPMDDNSLVRYLNKFMRWLDDVKDLGAHIVSPGCQSPRIMLSCALGSFNFDCCECTPMCDHERIMRLAHKMIAAKYNGGEGFIEAFEPKDK